MTKNFTLDEFVKSDTARRLGINNAPDDVAIAHIGELVGAILQPLREAWGRPIIVTSGYRCAELNKAVGGVSNSAHLSGFAADVQPEDMTDFRHFTDFITAWVQGVRVPFDQIIMEDNGRTEWVHIAVRKNNGDQRRQLFGMKI